MAMKEPIDHKSYSTRLVHWLCTRTASGEWVSLNQKLRDDELDMFDVMHVFRELENNPVVEVSPRGGDIRTAPLITAEGVIREEANTYENTEYRIRFTPEGEEQCYARRAVRNAAALTNAQLADVPCSATRSWIGIVIALAAALIAVGSWLFPRH
jgi:hypothetical protein